MFQVYDTVAILGMWDHNICNCRGLLEDCYRDRFSYPHEYEEDNVMNGGFDQMESCQNCAPRWDL